MLFFLYALFRRAKQHQKVRQPANRHISFKTSILIWWYCLTQTLCLGVYYWLGVPQQPKADKCLKQRRSSYWLNVWLAPRHPKAPRYAESDLGAYARCIITSGTCSLPTRPHPNTVFNVINKELWECNLTCEQKKKEFRFGVWKN